MLQASIELLKDLMQNDPKSPPFAV